ncbi:MAG: hypothetical protein DIU67_011280 [Actinomycetes bacterium]|nr:MAG: hypothetical protein DIU67_01990 [Actinomycetota bacterium]
MYRLAELSDKRRKQIGAGLLTAGILGLVLGVITIHWASYPETVIVDGVEVPYVVDFMNWFPRGALWLGLGYLVVFGAVTLSLVGGAFLWVLNQPMTWTRATIAAMLSWIGLVFYLGMVPSEWLNYAQTQLDWSSQRIALTLPRWLMLNNTVEISWAVVRDAIQMGYSLGMLGVAIVLGVQIQKIKEGRPASAAPVEKLSPYGRPLVRGEG